MAVRDPAWDAWFDIQYDLTVEIRDQFLKRTKGRSDAFKAAVLFGVMESLNEDIRRYIELPPTDGEALKNDGSQADA